MNCENCEDLQDQIDLLENELDELQEALLDKEQALAEIMVLIEAYVRSHSEDHKDLVEDIKATVEAAY